MTLSLVKDQESVGIHATTLTVVPLEAYHVKGIIPQPEQSDFLSHLPDNWGRNSQCNIRQQGHSQWSRRHRFRMRSIPHQRRGCDLGGSFRVIQGKRHNCNEDIQ